MPKHSNAAAWFRYPKYKWQQRHAVVIGAGIAGCQTAWHLVQQGWQVTLIEREKKVAQQASGNPAGIISPKMTAQVSSGEDFYVSCFGYAIQQLTLLKTKHTDLDWQACGLLQLAHNEREEQRWDSLKDREFDSEFLQLIDQQQSSEIAGLPINYKASYFPQAGWINPINFCETLLKDCGDNCKLILETDAIKLSKQANIWKVLNHEDQNIASAEVVVVTSGKDLNQFSQTNTLPSMPVAGQTTVAPTNPFASQLKTTIGHEGYLTPASDNTSQLTFGASFERSFTLNKKNQVDINNETDKSNLNQLSKYLPELTDSFTEVNSAHSAVRMTTPDRFPYVGGLADIDFYKKSYHDLHQGKQYKEYPDAQYLDGLFVLAGLGSRGLTTSSLCAKILSDILNNKVLSNTISDKQRSNNHKSNNNDLDVSDFDKGHLEDHTIQLQCHPARYLIKDLKRNKKS